MPFQFYGPVDGMTQAAVKAITQDDAGRMWLATQRGVNRYDGTQFQAYTIEQGLPTNGVYSLYAHGRDMWLGDLRGNISVIRAGEVRTRRRAKSNFRALVIGLAAHADTLYASIEDTGLVALDISDDSDSGRVVFPTSESIDHLRVNDGNAWFIHKGTLMRQDLAREWAPQPIAQGIVASIFSADGQHWLLDDRKQVGVFADGQFVPRYQFDVDVDLYSMTIDGDGTIWARADRSIHGISPGLDHTGQQQLRSYSFDIFGEIDEVFTDREGTLWVGAEQTARYLGARFEHFPLAQLGYTPVVWSVIPRPDGGVFIGANDRVLEYYDGQLRDLSELAGLPTGGTVDTLITSSDQRELLVSVQRKGVFSIDLATMTPTLLDNSLGLRPRSFAFDSENRLWVAGVNGLYRREGNGLVTMDSGDDRHYYAIVAGDDGTIWYTVDGLGLVRLEPQNDMRKTTFAAAQGFDAGEYNDVRWFAPDDIWVSAENGKLFHFDGERAHDIGPQTAVRFDSAYFVEPGADGTILVGGSAGVYHIDPATRDSILYSYAHGFLGIETNAGASSVDTYGNIWMGTIDGFVRMDRSTPMEQVQVHPPQIIAMSSEDGQVNAAGELELPWRFKALGFEFAAVSQLYPQNIEYSYRIAGRDERWSAPSHNHQIEVSGLSAGRYALEVRARLTGQSWSPTTSSETIIVLAPVWRRPWFVALVAVLAGVAALLAVRFRTRRIEAANRRLRREVLERTRSIQLAKERLEQSNQQLSAEMAQRQKSEQARRDVEERFRRAFEFSPIGMALLTADRTMLNANRALRRMLWPAAEDAHGTAAEDSLLDRVAPHDVAAFDDLICSLESGHSQSAEIELQLFDSAGVALDAVVHLSAVRQANGDYRYAVCQVQDVTDARRMTEQLAYQANYDELTGLLNRRAFEKAVERAHTEAGQHSELSYLMYMDLDQFKIVNDTSGHAAGDELLKQVSQLLRDQVRSDDVVSRLGGDEFALLLWQCPRDAAARIAEKIRAAVEEFQFHWGSEIYRIGVSIGAVALEPGSGGLEELQQLADAACYEAKDAGRNCVRFAREASEQSGGGQRSQMRWVQRLRDAMDNNRFALYGQQIKPTNGSKTGPVNERMEVLLRLREPTTRRLVPPGAFLPAAERYGLMPQLDRWVVESLIRTLYVHDAFGASERKYWVNLSGSTVSDPRFADFLVSAVRNAPLPPGMLNFEITETAVMRSVSDAGKLMSKLRDLGCQFALDDFGSGLSSFGYLKKLPVDYLKIDGMFIRDILADPTDRIFVRSIIDIAHTLGIEVVTEFVENNATLALVTELGADYVQGFGIHRPEMLFPQFPALSHSPASQEQRAGGAA